MKDVYKVLLGDVTLFGWVFGEPLLGDIDSNCKCFLDVIEDILLLMGGSDILYLIII